MSRHPIEIRVCMTAHIEVETEEQALRIAQETFGSDADPQEFEITKHPIDVSDDVDLSPWTTVYGCWDGDEGGKA